MNRRHFLKAVGATTLGAAALAQYGGGNVWTKDPDTGLWIPDRKLVVPPDCWVGVVNDRPALLRKVGDLPRLECYLQYQVLEPGTRLLNPEGKVVACV